MLQLPTFSVVVQVNLAYENVKEVDGLDITKEGTEMWEAALKRYDERIDRVEVSEKQVLYFLFFFGSFCKLLHQYTRKRYIIHLVQ